MLWQFIIAGTKEHSEGHKHPRPPKEYICKFGGLLPIQLTHWRRVQGLMWGARGAFPLAAAMFVAVVAPVVFCAKATDKKTHTLKLVGGYQKVYL
jgi:hypothetical protein